jgi:dihydrodipicolinate synthase/N-acetylneuraminate lyase
MHSDITRSVLAVPPLARKADLTLDRTANAALIRHIEQGGVRTLMYGGNANFYNVGLAEYPALLDMLLELAGPDTWVIPSAGPDFGKMMDQAAVLRERPFPTAMVLPAATAYTPAGAEDGIRRFAERLGKPVIVYVKSEGYISPAAVARLAERGMLKAVKYAIVRENPERDAYLDELLESVDRSLVISGMGERPAIVHWREFGLRSFTSGSVCIAPGASQSILEALKRGDYKTAQHLRAAFLPLEDLRDAHNPMRVLHDAVSLAGIADMGSMLPLMTNLEPQLRDGVKAAALELRKFERSMEPLQTA